MRNWTSVDWDLPLIGTGDQALRVAQYIGKRSQLDKRIPITLLPDGGESTLPGDVTPLTSTELNLSSQLVDVVSWRPQGSGWNGDLEFYDATLYDDTIQTLSG